jgi:hypothetical protein
MEQVVIIFYVGEQQRVIREILRSVPSASPQRGSRFQV